MAYDRQTAFNVDAKEITTGAYHKGEGWEPNYITTSFGLKVNRAMVAGIVIETGEKTITIDDSTDTIKVQSFEEFPAFDNIKPKDTVLIIGKVREYGADKYIAPEICSKIRLDDVKYFNENKEKLKKIYSEGKIEQKTIEAEFSNGQDVVKEIVEEKMESTNNNNYIEKVLTYIEDEDQGSGVEKVKILDKFPIEDIGDVIDTLILEGDIFEIKPSVFKVLK